jgi:transcriptional regulator with XRE-family HTH domain
MSQETLARKAGVSRSTLHKVETGEGCSLEVLVWLADALGVGPADLFITEEQGRALNYMTLKLLARLSKQLKK